MNYIRKALQSATLAVCLATGLYANDFVRISTNPNPTKYDAAITLHLKKTIKKKGRLPKVIKTTLSDMNADNIPDFSKETTFLKPRMFYTDFTNKKQCEKQYGDKFRETLKNKLDEIAEKYKSGTLKKESDNSYRSSNKNESFKLRCKNGKIHLQGGKNLIKPVNSQMKSFLEDLLKYSKRQK